MDWNGSTLIPVRRLFVHCSLTVGEDITCKLPATSAVKVGGEYRWRCHGHRGQLRPGETGPVYTEIPESALRSDG